MNLITRFMTVNDCFRAGRKLDPVRGIVVHSTATPGIMAERWFELWNKPNVSKCVHAFIDDTGIFQYIPFTMRGWHAGSGIKGSANNTHIGFEICEPSDMVFHYQAPIKLGAFVNSYAVKGVQQQLNTLGLYKGDINGVYNDITALAVRQYQSTKGLRPDGVINRDTWIKLASEPNSVCRYNPQKNADYFNKIYANAVELCVMLCKQFNLTEQTVICHSEAYKLGIGSNHSDIMHWFPLHGKTIDTFRADVGNALRYVAPVIVPTPVVSGGGSMPNPTPNVAIRMLIDNHQIMASTDMPKIKAELIKRIDSGAGKIGVLTDTKSNILFRYEKVKKAIVPSTPVVSGGGGAPQPTQKPTLRLNSNGAFVVQLQNKLNALGFNVGKIDGDFGDKTRLAVIAFQKVNKLVADGIVGINSWKALDYVKPAPKPNPTPNTTQYPTLRKDSNGAFVVQLQNKLNALGFDCGRVDGDFGSGTLKGVIAFQKARGLVADGIFGAKSWFALDQSIVKKAVVVATSLNIRKSANILSGKVGFYRKGEQIIILKEQGSWILTNRGWISSKYVKRV